MAIKIGNVDPSKIREPGLRVARPLATQAARFNCDTKPAVTSVRDDAFWIVSLDTDANRKKSGEQNLPTPARTHVKVMSTRSSDATALGYARRPAHSKSIIALLHAVAAPVVIGTVCLLDSQSVSLSGPTDHFSEVSRSSAKPASSATAGAPSHTVARQAFAQIMPEQVRAFTPATLVSLVPGLHGVDRLTPDSEGLGAPLDFLRVTSNYGMRYHPILGFTRMHQGVDFGASEGTPVMAADDGVVTDAGPAGGYGNMIRIRHAGGWQTGYAHLAAFASGISAGTRVTRGELIAFVGHTGLATGPHLHFEVSLDGVKLDPMATQVAGGGTHVFFRWAGLLGQSRAIDLAYRRTVPQLPDVHRLGRDPGTAAPAVPTETTVATRDPPPGADATARIFVTPPATLETTALLAPAPTLDLKAPPTFLRAKYLQGIPATNHHLAVPASW